MTVELMNFPKMENQKAIQEAASQGLQSMEHLIRFFSHQQQHPNNQSAHLDCTYITDHIVSKFKKVISRTGHARFRRSLFQPVHFPTSHPLSSQTLNLASALNLTLTLAPSPVTALAIVSPTPIELSIHPARRHRLNP
ncbi:hypothetical protein TB2_012879 [Malus domestica]